MARLVVVLMLVCVCSVAHVSSKDVRNKRNVQAMSIQSVLQSFIYRINTMKGLIRKQNTMIRAQHRTIRILKWILRRKGTQERMNEVESDFKHQTIILKHSLKLPTLTAWINSINKSEQKLKRFSESIKLRKSIISDIYDRVVMRDQRINCKIFYTKWDKQADYKIGHLDKHSVECPNQEFLQTVLFQRKDGGLASPVRYKYRCCRYNIKDKWVPKGKIAKNQQN